MSPLPFDRIVLREEAGPREVTLPQFMALPLTSRIRHILGRSVDFYRGRQAVDRGEALRGLSAMQGDGRPA